MCAKFGLLFKARFCAGTISSETPLKELVMDINTPFDRALEVQFRSEAFPVIYAATGRSPDVLRNAAVFVVDTLDLAWLGAKAVFETKAKPEHAFQVFDRLVATLANMPRNDEMFDRLVAALANMPRNDEIDADEPVSRPSIEELLRSAANTARPEG